MWSKIRTALRTVAQFTMADDDHGVAGEYVPDSEPVQGNWAYERNDRFDAMCKAADAYVCGNADGDTLHSAVVDYTDTVKGRRQR